MDHLLTTMDHFLTSVDRLFAGVLLSTLQKPLPFSDDQAYVLLMCMLFAVGGIVAAQAVFLFVFYVVYFLLGVLRDKFLSDVITPDKYKAVTKGEVNKIFNVASNAVSDLQSQVKMLVAHNAEYTRAMEELLAREVDRIEFEKKVMRWAEQQ